MFSFLFVWWFYLSIDWQIIKRGVGHIFLSMTWLCDSWLCNIPLVYVCRIFLTHWLSTLVPYGRNYIKHPHSGSHPSVTAVSGFRSLLWPPRIPGTHTVHRHPHMQNTQTYKIKKWNENECTQMGRQREGCVPEKRLFQNSGLRLPVSGSCSNSIPVSLEFSQALCLSDRSSEFQRQQPDLCWDPSCAS